MTTPPPPPQGFDADPYITTQIQRLRSGRYDSDDCLFRIASHADLIAVGEDIDDTNRDRILQWVSEVEAQLQTPPIQSITADNHPNLWAVLQPAGTNNPIHSNPQ